MSEHQGTQNSVYQFQPLSSMGFLQTLPTRSIEVIEPFQPIPYNQSLAKGLGITQITIGGACAILNIMLIITNNNSYFCGSVISYGIWGGVLILVAGILQLLSAKKSLNKCLIVGTMVMCIIAACASAVILSLGIMDAYCGSKQTASAILGSMMAILALGEAVLSILSSALCCNAMCCRAFNPISPHRGFVIGQFGYQRLDVPISSVPPAYSQSEVSTREVPEIATVAHY